MSDNTPTAIQEVLKSQYHAGFQMLRKCIESLSDDKVNLANDRNASWQVAYHALFYTHMYLQPSLRHFEAWGDHRKEYSSLGSPGDAEPLARAQLLEYCSFCQEGVDGWVDALNLDADSCGFWWYKMGKLEHQLVNIRHLQHHTAQLADRLRIRDDKGIDWVAAG